MGRVTLVRSSRPDPNLTVDTSNRDTDGNPPARSVYPSNRETLSSDEDNCIIDSLLGAEIHWGACRDVSYNSPSMERENRRYGEMSEGYGGLLWSFCGGLWRVWRVILSTQIRVGRFKLRETVYIRRWKEWKGSCSSEGI